MSEERQSAPAFPLRAGMLIGRYELLEELGSGGMGVVFRAHDREMDRVVPHAPVELALVPRVRRHAGVEDRAVELVRG